MLVARHEPEIGGTTNVADHPEFASRKTTKVIDGITFTGWFTEDFTLKELKTLRAKERLPDIRPNNTKYDGKFEIPTFQEVLDLRAQLSRKLHRQIGVYPETKHPSYFRSIGLPLEPKLVSTLNRNGLNRKGAPVFVQSFEIGNLQAARPRPEGAARAAARRAATCIPPATRASPATARWRRPPACARSRPTPTASGRGRTTSSRAPPTTPPASRRASSRTRTGPACVVHPYTFRRENTFVPLRAALVVRPRRDRRPRLGDPPVHPGSAWTAFFTDNADTASPRNGVPGPLP